MSETKNTLFDNDRVTKLVAEYIDSDYEPSILSDIIAETNTLIMVIASKYASPYILQDDLMQEARMHMIKAIKIFDVKRGKKLYSYLSVVIRNSIIDYIRKQKPTYELLDMEDTSSSLSDGEFIAIIAEDMRGWFEHRFPTLVTKNKAGAILQVIIGGLINEDSGKRKIINTLVDEFGYKPLNAKLLYEAVLVKLRILTDKPNGLVHSSEYSLEPELQEIVTDDYNKVKDAFKGLSLRFNMKGKS